jgi:hypothetical protein
MEVHPPFRRLFVGRQITVQIAARQTILPLLLQPGTPVTAVAFVSLLLAAQTPTATPPDTTPRDSIVRTGSRTALSRRFLGRLPIDDPRDGLVLVPGVLQRGNSLGVGSGTNLSLRLGDAGGAAVYIDGAPARLQITGGLGITPPADALDTIAVTTGLPSLDLEDGRGGVIAYITPSGGPRLEAHLLAHSDAPFGDRAGVGYNRFAASAGGPLGQGFAWFAAAEVFGQQSAYRGLGAAGQPAFSWGPTDTVVDSVAVPTFQQSSGRRRPFDWLTGRRALGKLAYRYGAGGQVALTGIVSDDQQRFYPGAAIGDPALFSGAHAWSRLLVVNWSQTFGGARPVRLHVTASAGSDRGVSGLLTPSAEASTREPALGMEWSSLAFTGTDSIGPPLTDQIVRNIRSNAGLRVPLLNRLDLRNTQAYRLNPFGLADGWPISGSDGTLEEYTEQRGDVRATATWSPAAPHLVRTGLDYHHASETSYQADLISEDGLDAWTAHPQRLGAFAEDRITLGSLVLDFGGRVDHFSPGGDLPVIPGRTFSNPAWELGSDTSDAAYARSVAQVYRPARSHTIVSPRARATYAPTPRSAFWVEVGQVALPPNPGQLFALSNSDLSFSSATASPYGRDVPYIKATQAELGVEQRIAPRVSVDASAFVEHVGTYQGHLRPFDDPANPGRTINIEVLTTGDPASVTGINAALEWRLPGALLARGAYSLAHRAQTTTQTLSALIQASPTAGPLSRSSATLLLRAASGVPYYPPGTFGLGTIVPPSSTVGSTQLPWSKMLDLRIGSGLHLGRVQGTVYADAHNLLNWRSILGAFAETGTQTNTLFQQGLVSPELSNLRTEAQQNGALLSNGDVDLRPDCATWTGTSGGPVNCAALRGVERRFGNGDGLYDPSEQAATLNAWYQSFYGAWRFYEPGRTIRIGVDLTL